MENPHFQGNARIRNNKWSEKQPPLVAVSWLIGMRDSLQQGCCDKGILTNRSNEYQVAGKFECSRA